MIGFDATVALSSRDRGANRSFWEFAMFFTPSSTFRVAAVRCSLAAIVAVCAHSMSEKRYAESAEISSATKVASKWLLTTPIALANDDLDFDAQERESQHRFLTPAWSGVEVSAGHAEIVAADPITHNTVVQAPWSVIESGGVGQPLVFSVRVLASAQGASMHYVSSGRTGGEEFQRARNLTPAKPGKMVVNAGSQSPATVEITPDGASASGVLATISVPAIKGDKQVAWAYPQTAVQGTDGSWTVSLGVGAATQKEVDAYRQGFVRADEKRDEGMIWLIPFWGAVVYFVAALLLLFIGRDAKPRGAIQKKGRKAAGRGFARK